MDYMFRPAVLTSLEWWKSQEKDIQDKIILDIVERLLTSVASSAGVERAFSTFGVVHSKLRNQLGIEKAAKLFFLYKNFN